MKFDFRKYKEIVNLLIEHRVQFGEHDLRHDIVTIKIAVKGLMKVPYTELDIKEYMMCLEEVNPGQDEAIAIETMSKIARKYK